MEELKKIVREFDKLLLEKGCKNLGYSVNLDSEQGVGFFPETLSTRDTMRTIISERKYQPLLDNLKKFAGSIDGDAHETMSLSREKVYRL